VSGRSLIFGFSPDGTRIVFASKMGRRGEARNLHTQIYVKDLRSGQISLVSSSKSGAPGNADSASAQWSPDGTKILFGSAASNLVAGYKTTNGSSAYIKDLRSGMTITVDERADVDADTARWSSDGRYIAFESNLITMWKGRQYHEAFLRDTRTGKITVLTATSRGVPGTGGGFECYSSCYLVWSPDGGRVAFTGQMPNLVAAAGSTPYRMPNAAFPTSELFIKNVRTGKLSLASSAANGAAANNDSCSYNPPVWSPDGKRIFFESWASNLTLGGGGPRTMSVYIKNLTSGLVSRVSPPNATAISPSYYTASWSPDGSAVVYETTPIQNGDRAPFVPYLKNLKTGNVTALRVPAQGRGPQQLHFLGWSRNARMVLVESGSARGPKNGRLNLFVINLASSKATLLASNTQERGYAAFWDPSRRRVAWSTLSGKGGIHLRDLD
jgi:Tol biopolymer transport system component